MQVKTDEELLVAHLAGQPGAFDALVQRYVKELFGFLCRFVGNANAAEDIVQETFLQVHLAASTFDPSRSFKPWLYTIAANKGRDYLRTRTRRQEFSLDSAGAAEDRPDSAERLEARDAVPEGPLEAGERADTVRSLVAQMPEHLRLVLLLGYYQELPYAQIANILRIPVGTVKSRLHAAVAHFARLWADHARSSRHPEQE